MYIPHAKVRVIDSFTIEAIITRINVKICPALDVSIVRTFPVYLPIVSELSLRGYLGCAYRMALYGLSIALQYRRLLPGLSYQEFLKKV